MTIAHARLRDFAHTLAEDLRDLPGSPPLERRRVDFIDGTPVVTATARLREDQRADTERSRAIAASISTLCTQLRAKYHYGEETMRRVRFTVGEDDRGRPVVRARMAPPDHRNLDTLRERQRSVEEVIARDATRARAQRPEDGLLRRRHREVPMPGVVTLAWARRRLDELMSDA